MQHEAFDVAKGVRVDEDVVVGQDGATYAYEGAGSHEGDEDDGEQEEEQDDRLLACLCRTLILIASNNFSLSLYIAYFIFFLHLKIYCGKIFNFYFKIFTFSNIKLLFPVYCSIISIQYFLL